MRIFILFFFTFYILIGGFSQSPITTLSQKSNHFISTDSYGLTWISSVDGVNVYNGLDVRVYRPGNYNMIGTNVQSHFFEDCEDNIWFSTYNALHCFLRDKDDFEVYQFRDSTGQFIDDSYKVLGYTEPFVFLRYGDYLGIFDINVNRITRTWNLNLAQYHYFDVLLSDNKLYLLAAIDKQFSIVKLDDFILGKPRQTNISLYNGQVLSGVQFKNERQIILTYYKKNYLDLYHIDGGQIEMIYQDSIPINYSKYISRSNELLVNDDKRTKLISFNDNDNVKVWTFPNDFIGNPTPINLHNDIVYQGIDGKGILIFHRYKQKMKHLPMKEGNLPANVRAIIRSRDGTFWYGSRDRGIGHFDKNGRDLGHYHKGNNKCPSNFILQIVQNSNGDIFGIGGNDVVKYHRKESRFLSLKNRQVDQYHYIGAFASVKDDELLAVDYINYHFLHRLTFHNDQSYSFTPITVKGSKANDEFVQIHTLNPQKFIICINSSEVALLNYEDGQASIIKRYKINSPANDILIHQDSIYLSTDGGLYIVDKNFNQKPRKIIDVDGKLNQNIYCTLIYKDKFFLSTNDGLYMYTPASNVVHRFTKADGIQDLEYNSLAGFMDDDGVMIFGGVNGVNIFHPDSIRFLQEPSKIYLSKFLINDESHPLYKHADGIKNIKLPYSENTLSFAFNGIDYADQTAIKLKYQMLNYDKHPVGLDKNDGFARYTNLPPGDYDFLIFATNSDGIWNEGPRTINITIDPPYWRTWWFRLLVLLAAFGSGYSLVRARYNRKIEKQNLILREQALIIEKQQGIEAERARIASEMHDDLGSGLTTIRFLSERALKSVTSESEINEIRKIADQSNALVSNMSEIIWALNSQLDNSEELIAYLRRYVGEYLSEHGIAYHFESYGELSTNVLTGEKRRNIFLVIKEILHNIVKYSGANAVELKIVFQPESMNVNITEIEGVGFDYDNKIGKGNGLYNIQKRINKLNGHIKYDRSKTGMKVIIKIPLENE